MSIFFRAFYGTPKLSTKNGFPTNAIYTFTRIVLQINQKFNQPFFLFTADSGRDTFRIEISAEYKANRPEAPEELKIQIPECFKIINSIGCKSLIIDGFEADDIIAESVRILEPEFDKIFIASQDKDLLQLVKNPTIIFYDPFKVLFYSEEDVKKKYDLYPSQLPILLALTGDPSDNVKGIPGIGPKTATKIAKSFKTVDEFLNSFQSCQEEPLSKLSCYCELVKQNLELVYLKPRQGILPDRIKESLNKLHLSVEFFQLCEVFEFNSIIKKYGSEIYSSSIGR